jgi:5'-nucleotidase
MRRVSWLLACVILAVTGAAPGEARAAALTLLHVNDTHSHLEAMGPRDAALDGTVGGLAKAATVIAALRASEPNPLFVHAGDLFQGDLYFNATLGATELQLLSRLGLDAMAVGNHEFYLGSAFLDLALSRALPGARPVLLSANLDVKGIAALRKWVKKNALREVGGVRVGLFGMTTPFDPIADASPGAIRGADVTSLLAVAAAQVAELRAQGAQVVVCLSHLGLALDQLVAASVPGIDVVVGGHDHLVLPQPVAVAGAVVVQAGDRYRFVGKLRLEVEPGRAPRVTGYELVPVDAAVPRAPQVSAVVEPLEAGISDALGFDAFHLPLAFSPEGVSREIDLSGPVRDTGLGDLITDAERAAAGTQLAFTANGLVQEGIAPGPVVGDDLFRPVGLGFNPDTVFGFRLVRLDIGALELVRALETTLEAAAQNPDFFLQVSGMRFAYDPGRPAGERVDLASLRIGDAPLDPAATYSCAVNEAVVQLLPRLGITVSNVGAPGALEFQALLGYVLARGPVLDYPADGRILAVAR